MIKKAKRKAKKTTTKKKKATQTKTKVNQKKAKKTSKRGNKTTTAKKKTRRAATPKVKKSRKPHTDKRSREVNQEDVAPKKLKPVNTGRVGSAPLVIEPYPKEYTGLPFLTLIQFRKQPMLVIVDNVDADSIRAYVLDMCGPEGVDEEKIILIATEWFQSNNTKYPISIEFSRRGMTGETGRIYRTFDVEFVSRVIGPAPSFPMDSVKSVRRRRRKAVPPGVEVVTRRQEVGPSFAF